MKVVTGIVTILCLCSFAVCYEGVDVSEPTNFTNFECLRRQGYNFAIVRCFLNNGSIDASCFGNSQFAYFTTFNPIDIYVVPCFSCGNPYYQVTGLLNYLKVNKVIYRTMWLQIDNNNTWSYDSTADNEIFFLELINVVQFYDIPYGVYTSYNDWMSIMGNLTVGYSTPLWYYNYDNVQNFSDFTAFGGWTKPTMKQYESNVTTGCGVTVNLNWVPTGTSTSTLTTTTTTGSLTTMSTTTSTTGSTTHNATTTTTTGSTTRNATTTTTTGSTTRNATTSSTLTSGTTSTGGSNTTTITSTTTIGNVTTSHWSAPSSSGGSTSTTTPTTTSTSSTTHANHTTHTPTHTTSSNHISSTTGHISTTTHSSSDTGHSTTTGKITTDSSGPSSSGPSTSHTSGPSSSGPSTSHTSDPSSSGPSATHTSGHSSGNTTGHSTTGHSNTGPPTSGNSSTSSSSSNSTSYSSGGDTGSNSDFFKVLYYEKMGGGKMLEDQTKIPKNSETDSKNSFFTEVDEVVENTHLQVVEDKAFNKFEKNKPGRMIIN